MSTTPAPATATVSHECGVCGLTKPVPPWHRHWNHPDGKNPRYGLEHMCMACTSHQWHKWAEDELVAAYKDNAHAIAMAFYLINKARKRARRRRATQKTRQIMEGRRVSNHKGNALRPLLRRSRMRELGYEV